MKRIISTILCLGCLGVVNSQAQLLSVTATLTDPSATTWTKATCTIATYNSTGGQNYYNGTAIPNNPTCSVNGSGVLSASLYNTSTLNPASAQYQFTINTGTSAPAQTFLSPVTSADMSSTIQALLKTPSVLAGYGALAYNDTEVVIPPFGYTYYNLTIPAWRQYGLTGWSAVGAGGSPFNPAAVAITGGTIDGTTIGGSTPAQVTGIGVVAASGGYGTASGGFTFTGFSNIGIHYQGGNLYFNQVNGDFVISPVGTFDAHHSSGGYNQLGSVIYYGAPANDGAGAVGMGNQVDTASNCNQGGTLTSVAGCYVAIINGTTRYLPYF